MKNLFIKIISILVIMIFVAVLGSCVNEKNNVSPADDFSEGAGIIAWWDDWVRYTDGSVDFVQETKADTAFTGSRNDEGRGPYARQVDSLYGKTTLDLLHNAGLRAGAWIETQGQTRAFLMAVHQNDDGSFEIDPQTGAAKLYAWVWGWTSNGPDANPDANYLCWSGVQSFVNDEPWAYPYVLSNYPDIDVPTYTDGTPAIGYVDGGDHTTPQLAKIYDACAGKDFNGRWIRYDETLLSSGDETYALHLTKPSGGTVTVDDMSFDKDTAAPFWIQYARNSLDFWISAGVDFFWCDNWNCWDTINNNPLNKAFGDWSVYKFKDFLKKHPELGIEDPDNFDIKKYIKEKALEMDPECIPNYWQGYGVWSDKEWTKDKIWMAYLAFKVESNIAYNTELFNTAKELSLKYNGDRDAVAMEGNDFPYMTLGSFDCDAIDIISTEYNANYLASTGFNTTGFPPNRYSGHAYSLLSASARSHNAVVWYYATNYPYTNTSGRMLGYEALAYNCLLHNSFSGTKESNTAVNETIGKLKETFSDRKLYAEIGLVYSPDSETSELCPGGFCTGEKNTHDISYMGWGQALDELNVPYKGIQMQRLAKTIDSCSIVILPNVRSISQDTIDNVLKPWVKKGGVLVITGKEAGICDSRENLFAPRSKAALAELDGKHIGKGKIIYIEDDPCYCYFLENKEAPYSEMEVKYLNSLKKMIEKWYKKGYMNRLLTLENVDMSASIVTTLNYSSSGKTFFVDIVNMQYDPDNDVLSEIPEEISVKLRIPSNYWGRDDLEISIYNDNTGEISEISSDRIKFDGIYVTIKVPDFTTYSVIIIK